MESNLADYLVQSGVLKTPEIIKAFHIVDRADFVPAEYRDQAYEDYPLPIGRGQTISQPTTVAFMLELLQPKPGDKVLDIGSGSAWTTALLSSIVSKKGRVIGVEVIPELVELGRKNLKKYRFSQATIALGGKEIGRREEAPFDKILVSAAGETLPEKLVEQLKVGGTMIIPLGNSIWNIERVSPTNIRQQEYPGFVFVPLQE